MKEIKRIEFRPLNGRLASLCWEEDHLVDFGGGIIRYGLDGETKRRWSGFGYSFDGAIHWENGGYAITYQRLGTKALILKDDQILREINRSYYCAEVYEYPIAIFQGENQRVMIVHCPEKYNRLEIEDIESGKRAFVRDTQSADFFHSQLQVSPNGRYLLSAGWVWHPWDMAVFYDLLAVKDTPSLLDKCDRSILGIEADAFSSAVFLNSNRVLYAGQKEEDEAVNFLGVYDLAASQTVSEVRLDQPGGVLMPLGDHVVSFFDHPRLIEISTGKIVHCWDDIFCGNRHGSIFHHLKSLPKLALDPENARFAVGNDEHITVVALEADKQV